MLNDMGNWTSCFTDTNPLSAHKDVNGVVNELPQEGEESVGNLQHISEREQDDWNTDPSAHPKVATIFLERSKVQSTFDALIETVSTNCCALKKQIHHTVPMGCLGFGINISCFVLKLLDSTSAATWYVKVGVQANIKNNRQQNHSGLCPSFKLNRGPGVPYIPGSCGTGFNKVMNDCASILYKLIIHAFDVANLSV